MGAKTTALHIQGTLYNPCSQNKLHEEPWDADLQQARTHLGPKFSSWLCGIDHVSYALPFFLPAKEFPAGIKRGDFWQMWKTLGCSGEILCFYFLGLGLNRGGKKRSQIHMPVPFPLSFSLQSRIWEGAALNTPLLWAFFHSHISTMVQPWRQEGGWRNASDSCLPPLLALVHLQSHWGGWRISWGSLLLHALVPAFSKGLTSRSSLLFFHCPLWDSGVLRRREHQGLVSEGLDNRRWEEKVSEDERLFIAWRFCKRAHQCQAVFTQVACSSHCLWSPPPALSEIGSWIGLLKREV